MTAMMSFDTASNRVNSQRYATATPRGYAGRNTDAAEAEIVDCGATSRVFWN